MFYYSQIDDEKNVRLFFQVYVMWIYVCGRKQNNANGNMMRQTANVWACHNKNPEWKRRSRKKQKRKTKTKKGLALVLMHTL